jgi:2-polyprenyl-3-methyl-5-hydroxy-6-metoxy-1,4-benzoquinol methylase
MALTVLALMLRKKYSQYNRSGSTTADGEEIARFNAFGGERRNPDGQFKIIHKFNAVRVEHLLRRLNTQTADPPDALGQFHQCIPLYSVPCFTLTQSLDRLSDGRLDLGIGRGAVPLELSFFGFRQSRYRSVTAKQPRSFFRRWITTRSTMQ